MPTRPTLLGTVIRRFARDPVGLAGLTVLTCFVVLALFAPLLSPYDPLHTNVSADGRVARMEAPSARHWFGTDGFGRDILSQTIYGSRVALFVGLTSAICSTFIGLNIGLIAGYFGRRLDDLLMRLTDIVYGIPFLPFAMILLALLGPSLWNIILAITLITWRTTARAVRSQVLTLRHRAFVSSARVTGCGHWRIMYVHIAPNIISLSFAYTVITIAWSILTEASLSFLGYGDPGQISWGKILFGAYVAQAIEVAWWWVLPPGVAITIVVLAFFFVGRTFEEITNPRLQEE
jgi:peptide/nickel transport system permease protein